MPNRWGRRGLVVPAKEESLCEVGHEVGRQRRLAGIVTPDTILRWYRRLVAKKHDVPADSRRGAVHEYVGSSAAERLGRVKFSLEDAERFISEMADGTTALTQTGKGWALTHAIEGGQMLTPMIARDH